MYNNIPETAYSFYADSFFQPLNQFMAQLRKEEEDRKIPVIRRDTEMLLRSLIPLKKPERILEVGTACGYSALLFAALCPQASVISLEIREEYVAKAIQNIKKAEDSGQFNTGEAQDRSFLQRIMILQGDAAVTLEEMSKRSQIRKEPFDMVFMDGPKSHYLNHFQLIIPMISTDAVIVSDNILLGGMMDSKSPVSRRNMTMVRRMKAYLDYITNLSDYKTAVLALGDGIAITTAVE